MNYIRLITFLYALFLIRDDKLKKKLAVYRRIELVYTTKQNKRRGVQSLRKLLRKYFLNLRKKKKKSFLYFKFSKSKIVNEPIRKLSKNLNENLN
jgi:hypothetical protein